MFNLPLWREHLLDSMRLGLFLSLLAVWTTRLFSQHLHVSGDPVVFGTSSRPRREAVRGREQQAELLHPHLSPRLHLGLTEPPPGPLNP